MQIAKLQKILARQLIHFSLASCFFLRSLAGICSIALSDG